MCVGQYVANNLNSYGFAREFPADSTFPDDYRDESSWFTKVILLWKSLSKEPGECI